MHGSFSALSDCAWNTVGVAVFFVATNSWWQKKVCGSLLNILWPVSFIITIIIIITPNVANVRRWHECDKECRRGLEVGVRAHLCAAPMEVDAVKVLLLLPGTIF